VEANGQGREKEGMGAPAPSGDINVVQQGRKIGWNLTELSTKIRFSLELGHMLNLQDYYLS